MVGDVNIITELETKQDKLIEGNNITIVGNTISSNTTPQDYDATFNSVTTNEIFMPKGRQFIEFPIGFTGTNADADGVFFLIARYGTGEKVKGQLHMEKDDANNAFVADIIISQSPSGTSSTERFNLTSNIVRNRECVMKNVVYNGTTWWAINFRGGTFMLGSYGFFEGRNTETSTDTFSVKFSSDFTSISEDLTTDATTFFQQPILAPSLKVGGNVELQGTRIDLNSADFISSNAGGTSGQHLVIFINGTEYKIKLENAQ